MPPTTNAAQTSMDSHLASDRALMNRLEAGDVEALDVIYDRFAGVVLALCLRILRDHARAEEAMQDTFLQLWNQADRYDATRGKLSTFLFQIARSRALDRVRSESSRSRLVRPSATDHEVESAESGDASPLQSAIQIEEQKRARYALNSLSPIPREVFTLFYFDGLTHPEIAVQVGVPLGTVKTHLRRGLSQMRQTLAHAPVGAAQ